MEKNEFYELLDGIIDCADKVAKLGRLLKEFVPQFVALLQETPIEVPLGLSTGMTGIELFQMYNVTPTTISAIKLRRNYSWL